MLFRSSLLSILCHRLLTLPLGVVWRNDDKNATYASLLQSLVMAKILQPGRVTQELTLAIPYDFACSIYIGRGLYFGTIKSKIINCNGLKSNASVTKTRDDPELDPYSLRKNMLNCPLKYLRGNLLVRKNNICIEINLYKYLCTRWVA